MGERTNISTRLGAVLAVAVVSAIAGVSCGGKQAPPPPEPKHVGPAERILTVAKAWREMTQSEGFVNQPDVAFIRVTDQFTLHLESDSPVALVDIKRNELIRSPDGREFHCKVEGAVRASVDYAWHLDEASVSVRMPGAALPRKCKEHGFTKPFKNFPGLTATYALRGDQLIAIEPRTLRSSLLPAD